jgi:hypothetical protein
MNPQIIFWLAFAVLGISVAYCSKKYCMLKDNSTVLKRPYSWSRVQLAWWTVIILSSFIAILITYNEAPIHLLLQSSRLPILPPQLQQQ